PAGGGYGEAPDPCCCFPEPGAVACDQTQLCPSIEADCGSGTLGTGMCALDQASDAAVMCALTALADPSSNGSFAWSIEQSGGLIESSGTLHIGGSRAALEATTHDDQGTTQQAYAGTIPSDFDPEQCASFDTPGTRFECMLNATALQDGLTCHDVVSGTSSG
ncbi:MAG: hypothetical protein KUG77_24535, partial [Nannocystaceae bacterium]|nr:hypothetical protein [Nannocystaceae bacterium]